MHSGVQVCVCLSMHGYRWIERGRRKRESLMVVLGDCEDAEAGEIV